MITDIEMDFEIDTHEEYVDEGMYASDPDEDEDDEGDDEDYTHEDAEDRYLDSSWEDRFEMMGGGFD